MLSGGLKKKKKLDKRRIRDTEEHLEIDFHCCICDKLLIHCQKKEAHESLSYEHQQPVT